MTSIPSQKAFQLLKVLQRLPKTSGMEKYKLGQFSDAKSFYIHVFDAFPSAHLLLVLLLNNRALMHIKNGNPGKMIEDCTSIIDLIGPTYVPSHRKPVTSFEHGVRLDLVDELVKAMKRHWGAWEVL